MTQEQDRELERYLEGGSSLSDAYAGLPEAGPPARLDHAILAEAHRAVRAQPGRSAWRRWSLPLSLAATLVVAVLVGLEQSYLPREAEHFTAAPPVAAGEVAQDKFAPVAEAPPRSEASERRPAPAANVPGAKQESRAVREEVKEAGPVAEPPPPVAEPRADQGAPAKRRAERVAPAAAAPAPSAGKLQAPVTPGPTEAAPAAQEILRMNAAPAAAAPQTEPAMERAPAAAAPAPAMEMAPAAPAAAMLGEARPSSGVDAASAPLAPRAWLARIEKLKREGKREAAQKDLAAFMKRYPAYPLPKDLQDLR